MVAGDVIDRGDLHQSLQQRPEVFRAAPLVHHVAAQADDVWPGFPHGLQQAAVLPPEPLPVEVRQHHQPSAVPTGGQSCAGEGELLHRQHAAAHPDGGSRRRQRHQQQIELSVSAFSLRHLRHRLSPWGAARRRQAR